MDGNHGSLPLEKFVNPLGHRAFKLHALPRSTTAATIMNSWSLVCIRG
jgi:hypothetical protein